MEDLRKYAEVKPVVSTGITLTWVYLVMFPGAKSPERQQIEVDIDTRLWGNYLRESTYNFLTQEDRKEIFSGIITFRISYTARTWGADIENLLRDHIETLFQPEVSRVKRFVRKWHGFILKTVTGVIALGLLATLLPILINIYRIIGHNYFKIGDMSSTLNEIIIRKIDYIFAVSSGIFPIFLVMAVIMVSFIITGMSTWIGNRVASARNFILPSFLLLTRRAIMARDDQMRKYHRNWLTLTISIGASLVVGVAANVLSSFITR